METKPEDFAPAPPPEREPQFTASPESGYGQDARMNLLVHFRENGMFVDQDDCGLAEMLLEMKAQPAKL